MKEKREAEKSKNELFSTVVVVIWVEGPVGAKVISIFDNFSKRIVPFPKQLPKQNTK